MNDFFEPPRIAPMMIRCDPTSGRLTHLETHPHDPPETLKLLHALLATLQTGVTLPSATVRDPVLGAMLPPPAPIEEIGAGRWLSDVIEHYLKEVKHNKNLNSNTITYTYAPPLCVFRELISVDKKISDFDQVSRWDIRVGNITPQAIDQFVTTFWSFPDRRGRRNHADAREILSDGGEAQSRNNALKNFGYILLFLNWATKRDEVARPVSARLAAALDDAKPDDRGSAEMQALSPDDDEQEHSPGYVAFALDELKRLFEGPAFVAYAAGNASRYWIALLGLYAGLRIGEAAQLRARDFKVLDGIWCVVVTSSKLNKKGQRVDAGPAQRVKTFAGRRMLPLHPDLIRLGLLDYVAERTQIESGWMFDLPWYPKSGFGHYPTRDFPRLTKGVAVYQPKRKVFHSFRSTISPALEGKGLEGTLIDRFLGHSVRTIRARFYNKNSEGRTLPLRLVYEALCRLDFGIDIPEWAKVRTAKRQHLRKLTDQRVPQT
jgi:integrase